MNDKSADSIPAKISMHALRIVRSHQSTQVVQDALATLGDNVLKWFETAVAHHLLNITPSGLEIVHNLGKTRRDSESSYDPVLPFQFSL